MTVVKLGWLADDASITSRVVANLTSGYGPNFNIGERAQAFTHPLWFLLSSGIAILTSNIQLSMIGLGVVCTSLTAWLLIRGGGAVSALVVAGGFGFSFTLAEFGTSGLENPLSWLLILAMWTLAKQGRLLLAAVAAGLAMANRLDLAIVAVPFLFFWSLRSGVPVRMRLATLGISAIPPALWALFSWSYYGSPLPETFFAKVNTDIPMIDMLAQGAFYLFDLFRFDPVSGLLMLAGVVMAWRGPTRETRILVSCGVVLYSAYVVFVGGDFMSGRFWSVPIICGLAAVAERASTVSPRSLVASRPWLYGLALPVVAVLLLVPLAAIPIVRSPNGDQVRGNAHGSENRGIVDEWSFYVVNDGRGMGQWASGTRDGLERMHVALNGWTRNAVVTEIRVACGNVGRLSVEAGPTVHYVVDCGLSDPFLSRIPFDPGHGPWRIGHFERDVPPGYGRALASGVAQTLPETLRPLFNRTSALRRIDERWSSDVLLPPE